MTEPSVLVGPEGGPLVYTQEIGEAIGFMAWADEKKRRERADQGRLFVPAMPVNGSSFKARSRESSRTPLLATSEISGTRPSGLVVEMRANEDLFDEILDGYGRFRSQSDPERGFDIRTHHRSLDATADGLRANHLQARITTNEDVLSDHDFLVTHLATRGFVAGALAVMPGTGDLSFGQRMSALRFVSGASSLSSLYDKKSVKAPGITDRAGDRNLSDWAAWMRIASLGMAIAISRTPLKDEFPVLVEDAEKHEDETVKRAKEMNVLKYALGKDEEVYIKPNELYGTADVDFQERLAEIILGDDIREFTDVPDEYRRAAQELFRYCRDYRKVLARDESINLITDRPDFPAKLVQVIARRRRALRKVKTVDELAVHMQAADLGFDYRLRRYRDGEAPEILEEGLGYQLRERKDRSRGLPKFKNMTPPDRIEAAKQRVI